MTTGKEKKKEKKSGKGQDARQGFTVEQVDGGGGLGMRRQLDVGVHLFKRQLL